MKIVTEATVQIIFFSPTGNTRKIITAIASGTKFRFANPHFIDITSVEGREKEEIQITGDLIIFGVPIYYGKIPAQVIPVFSKLKGEQHWIVPIAVSGNVFFGECLHEMVGLLRKQHFQVIAAGNFVGKNSYSHFALPLGENRPDDTDLKLARDFGQQIADKFRNAEYDMLRNKIEGIIPSHTEIHPQIYAREAMAKPIIDYDKCTKCRQCWAHCPTEAIDFFCFSDLEFSFKVDDAKCIRCFGCVYICPFNALSIQHTMPLEMEKQYRQYIGTYQKPEIFL